VSYKYSAAEVAELAAAAGLSVVSSFSDAAAQYGVHIMRRGTAVADV
jgi:uncharacterized SAM-dependent methyltransferase